MEKILFRLLNLISINPYVQLINSLAVKAVKPVSDEQNTINIIDESIIFGFIENVKSIVNDIDLNKML